MIYPPDTGAEHLWPGFFIFLPGMDSDHRIIEQFYRGEEDGTG